MTKRQLAIITSVVMAFCVGCTGKGNTPENEKTTRRNDIPIDTALRSRLVAFGAQPRPAGKFAFHVYDITADKHVYGVNDTLALPSASCMKLLSGIAGLHLLGCDYHYWTAIFMRGNVQQDGTLKGDLAFKAGLDPQLQDQDLRDFAKTVRNKGVKRVGGKVFVDLTLKDAVKSEEHWYPWDLAFSKYGLFYKGADRVVKTLKASLRGQGIAVADSQLVLKATTRDFRCLYVKRRHIEDVIKRMWKNSSNTQATAMLYTIGNKRNPKGDPVVEGVEYLRKFLAEELLMTDSSLVVHDGCGLCTHNRLSPLALTSVLRYGYEDPKIRGMLDRNLSVAGVDGTLAREMTGSNTRGKIKAKTGTLSHPYGISSLAGICEGSNGHVLAFAIMDSEMSVLDARVLQRRLCEALVKPSTTKKQGK